MFANADEALWPEHLSNARRSSLKHVPMQWSSPAAAVQRGPKGLFTWVVTEGMWRSPRSIQVDATAAT